jgi:hypothetical protein
MYVDIIALTYLSVGFLLGRLDAFVTFVIYVRVKALIFRQHYKVVTSRNADILN